MGIIVTNSAAPASSTPMPWTHDPGIMAASGTSVGTANRCVYQRVIGSGMISKLRFYVLAGGGTGTLSVAVYNTSGSGASATPSTRLATSGSVTTPATGVTEVALDVSVWVDSTCWFALSCSSTTPTFAISARGNSNALEAGLYGFQSSAHPAPSSPSMTQADGSVALEFVIIGVP